jgi:hypothetical protein
MKYVPHKDKNGFEILSYPNEKTGFRYLMRIPESVGIAILKAMKYQVRDYGLDNKIAICISDPVKWEGVEKDGWSSMDFFRLLVADSRDMKVFVYKHDFSTVLMTYTE